jgi:hypothetical protein
VGHERDVAQHPRWLLGALLVSAAALSGCSKPGDARVFLRRPQAAPQPRPSGCIDTPFIGGDHRATTAGINCGRERSPEASLLRGRVVGEVLGGLPGAGIEGVWVTLHPLDPVEDRPLQLDVLPPAKVEVQTGPQGSFSVGLRGAEAYVIVVRAQRGSPPLAARRVEVADVERSGELVLTVPSEPTR